MRPEVPHRTPAERLSSCRSAAGGNPSRNTRAVGKSFPGVGVLSDVSEVFLRRRFGLSLSLPELRRDLVDLLRLRLQLLEADLDAKDLREDLEDRLRALRVDEVPARLPH